MGDRERGLRVVLAAERSISVLEAKPLAQSRDFFACDQHFAQGAENFCSQGTNDLQLARPRFAQ